jgi:ABC-type proline/glycine betaine transport system permease subunit
MQEGVFYFGLGFTHKALVWLPWMLIVLVAALLVLRSRGTNDRRGLLLNTLLYLPVIGLLGYWGMVW